MGLKDEILEQKRKEREQAKLDAETAQRENAQRFIELNENYEKGIVPQDWMDLYDKYAARIREWFLNNSRDFSCREPIEEEYYRSKANFGNGMISELTLLNEYLTKRLQNDGFHGAQFKLVEETETYATGADLARQQTAQTEANIKNMEKYRDDIWNASSRDAYTGGDLGYIKLKTTIVPVEATGKRQVYNIVVKCGIDDDDDDYEEEVSKNADTSTKNSTPEVPTKNVKLLHKSQILTIAGICAGIGLVTAIIMVFTTSILEMFIPIFAAMGFVYGFLFAQVIRYAKLAVFCKFMKYYTAINKHIVKAILCAVLLGGAIALGIFLVLKFM